MDRILMLKPSGITAHSDAVYGLCLKETFPRSMALRAPFGAFQSRAVVPLKMWLLQGNDAAMGDFSQKQLEARFLDSEEKGAVLGDTGNVLASAEPQGPRQRRWPCRFCCLRAPREVVPEQQQLGPLHGEWEDRKSQTTEWASRRGRRGPLSFHSRGPGGPRGRKGGRVLI